MNDPCGVSDVNDLENAISLIVVDILIQQWCLEFVLEEQHKLLKDCFDI